MKKKNLSQICSKYKCKITMNSLAFAREKDPIFYDEFYAQIIVWPGTDVKFNEINDFSTCLQTKLQLSYPIKFIGIIETQNGRHDLAFLVHRNDVYVMVKKKREYQMIWIDESYKKGNVYPKWFVNKYQGNQN